MSVLEGQLEKGKTANLLQYLQMNGADGCLSLSHPHGARAYIFLEDGEPVHISLGKPGTQGLKTDAEALALIFTWSKGQYVFQSDVASPIKTINSNLNTLLMSASVKLDEQKRNHGRLLYGGSILVADQLLIDTADRLELTILETRVLNQLDGIANLEEVADNLEEPLEDIIKIAENLQSRLLAKAKVATLKQEFLLELEHLVTNIMGPIGGVVVDDILYKQGIIDKKVPVRALEEILLEIKAELKNNLWQQEFELKSQDLLNRYGLKI